MKRKLLSALLITGLVFSMTACGSSSGSGGGSGGHAGQSAGPEHLFRGIYRRAHHSAGLHQ